MKNSKERVAIVGAGFAGLACAFDLAKNGFDVTVFEKESEAGGLAGSFTLKNGTSVEKFYHHLFTTDKDIYDFLEELGLKSKLRAYESKTGIYCDDKIYSLSSPLDLLKFKPLKFLERIKMGLGVLKAKAIRSYLRLEDMFATTWLKDNCGKEAYKKVWLPLLKGKFGDCYEEISAVWIWNKFKLRGGSRNNGGHEVLVYFENGFKEIISKICSKLEALGVKFLFDSPVDKVEKEGDEFLVYSNGSVYNFKKLSFTTSPKDFVDVVKFLPTDYKNSLMRIRHLANICLVLVLDKKFSDIYWLNVADENFPFVGIIEHTNFHSSEHYGGKHILYLSKYLKEYDVLYSYSKEELVDYSLKFLQKINPDFKKDSIEEAYLFKSKCSQPIIEKEYSKLLFSMKTKVDNLFFTSMAQIYPQDRGTNFAVKYGRMLAKEMLG